MRRTAFVVSISSLLLPTVRARPASRKFHPPPHLDEVLAEQRRAGGAITPLQRAAAAGLVVKPMRSSLAAARNATTKSSRSSSKGSGGKGVAVWAVLVANEVRSFLDGADGRSPGCAPSFVARLLQPLGAADVYFAIDSSARPGSVLQWAAALERATVAGALDVRSSGALRGRDAKLSLCAQMLERVERAVGRPYDFVLTTRPDLEHLQPVNGEAIMAAARAAPIVHTCKKTFLHSVRSIRSIRSIHSIQFIQFIQCIATPLWSTKHSTPEIYEN